MENGSSNPLIVALFFVLRCAVPLIAMLGISYLLKRLGFIVEAPPPPPDYDDQSSNAQDGGEVHGHA